MIFAADCLREKSALVTGASSGLGEHFALTLARHGARVVLAARRRDRLDKLAKKIGDGGGTAFAVALDVRDPASVGAAVEAAVRVAGPLTVLVNNAGIAIDKPLLEQSEQDWNDVVETNLSGAWRVAQAVARHMAAHDAGGSIINIASIAGLRVAARIPAYVASKAGLIRLTQAMALELARHRIRVNAIAPGYIETDLNRAFFESDAGKALIKRIPQRRIGHPDDLDGALLLLASDASSFMTGSVIAIDGGHLAGTL